MNSRMSKIRSVHTYVMPGRFILVESVYIPVSRVMKFISIRGKITGLNVLYRIFFACIFGMRIHVFVTAHYLLLTWHFSENESALLDGNRT